MKEKKDGSSMKDKRKLSEISKEEIEEVNKIVKSTQPSWMNSNYSRYEEIEYQIFEKSHSCIDGYTVVIVNDYLRSAGIDIF